MSHPENTFKEIIQSILDTIHQANNRLDRQDEKIDVLIQVLGNYIQTMYVHQGNIGQEQGKQILEELVRIKNLK